MNAELLRQHEAAKARRARINAAPACRTIPAPVRREVVFPILSTKTALPLVRTAKIEARYGADLDSHVRAYRRHALRIRARLLPVVLQATSQAFGVPVHAILSPSRTANVVRPRQIAAWVARTRKDISWPALGRAFNRDHTTMIHAVRQTEGRKDRPEYAKKIAEIEAYIDANWRGGA